MICVYKGISVSALCNQLPAEHRLLIEKLITEQAAGGRYEENLEKFVFEVLSSYLASVMVRLSGEELRKIILQANSIKTLTAKRVRSAVARVI